MPTFEFPLRLPRKLAPSFEFVTDFSNAPFWDPRSLRAEKLTPGPVRLGTKFVMEGGPFTRAVAERLPHLLRLSSSLPYEVTKFEPHREAVIEGETMLVRYHDRLVFSEDGDATRLRWIGTISLKWPFGWLNDLIAPLVRRIGEQATVGLPNAVDANVPESDGRPAPLQQKIITIENVGRVVQGRELVFTPGGARKTPAPEDVMKIVLSPEQRTLRNLRITQGYHDISEELRARTSSKDMNWCTLGTWASKTAGQFIRGDEVPSVFRKLLDSWELKLAVEALDEALDLEGFADGLLAEIDQIIKDSSEAVMVGNTLVFLELAGVCADFVETFPVGSPRDPEKLAQLLGRYKDGDVAPDVVEWKNHTLSFKLEGGQALLRAMIEHLYEAMFETDEQKRAELLLFANGAGGLHEQTRLQNYIGLGIDAPFDDLVLEWAHGLAKKAEAELSVHENIDRLFQPLARKLRGAWQIFATNALMTMPLPCGDLHLGDPIPQDPGVPAIPPDLQTIRSPKLSDLLERFNALHPKTERTVLSSIEYRVARASGIPPRPPTEQVEVGAMDWASLEQRMRFILTLFRMRQQDPDLFGQPFDNDQRAAIFEGRIPRGPL